MHVEGQKLHEIRFIESSGEIDCFRVSENYVLYSISDIRIPVHLISYDLNQIFCQNRPSRVFLKLERIYKMRNIFQTSKHKPLKLWTTT